MVYIPTAWVNGVPPPISAANLLNIEGGIQALESRIDALSLAASDYEAVGDAAGVTDASMTAASAVLTSPTAGFVSTDVGKAVAVQHAGVSAALLVTTIASWQSSTQVTLTAAASTTVPASRTVANGVVGRAVADGVMSLGFATLTSATASFTSGDVGSKVTVVLDDASTLTTFISAYTNATTVTLGQTAAAAATAGAVNILPSTLTSATAAFTAADVGRELTISGAGAAGATLSTRITAVNSGTSVQLRNYPSVAVTGATVVVQGTTVTYGTDNSTAFAAMRDAFVAARQTDDAANVISGNAMGGGAQLIGSGQYLVTTPGCLLAEGASVTRGWKLSGAGRDSTMVIFAPSSQDQALISNLNRWQHLAFADISFTSLDTTATFFDSRGDGNAQNYTFDRVNWHGAWKRGLLLQSNGGTANTNSEFSFNHCGVKGTWSQAFFDGGLADVSAEDQFVNYWFRDCQMEPESGNVIRMTRGGAVTVDGGSWIISGAAGGTMVQLLGDEHSDGAMSFRMVGTRPEVQRSPNVKLLYCEWPAGAVILDGIDMSAAVDSTIGGSRAQDVLHFKVGNTRGPNVSIKSCQLPGRLRVEHGTTSALYSHQFAVEHSTILQWQEAADYVETVVQSGDVDQEGSRIPVEFRKCRSRINFTIGREYAFDCTVNADTTSGGHTKTHQAILNAGSGGIGINTTLNFRLPFNSLITGVWLYQQGAAATGLTSTSTTWSATVQTTEAVPTVLGQVSGGGSAQLKDGFNSKFEGPPNFPMYCTAEGQRHLQLITNAGFDQTTTRSFAIVEYLA